MRELGSLEFHEKVEKGLISKVEDVEILGWKKVTEGSCFVVRAWFSKEEFLDFCFIDDLYDTQYWIRRINEFIEDIKKKGSQAWGDNAISTLQDNIY